MSKYRILEKEGTKQFNNICGNKHSEHSAICFNYIPKFIVQIVQENISQYHATATGECRFVVNYKDLKEFTSLDEARRYKYILELKEGIVRE